MNRPATWSRLTGAGLWLAALTASLPLAMLSVGSHARAPGLVDGLHGDVRVSGSLVSAPCVLAPESQEQEIVVGQATLFSLKQPGEVTVPVPVTVILDDCPGGPHTLEDRHALRGTQWLSGQSGVRMTLSGVADPDDGRFFRVSGDAGGIALRLSDSDGRLMAPGVAGRAQALYPGRNALTLQAQLWRKPQPLTAGEWNAVVHIDLEYE